MQSPTLTLSITHGYSDCDDCGGYEYGHFNAVFPDRFELRANHDGHLSSGSWDGEDINVYLWCLTKLGYAVHLNGERVYVQPFYEQHTDRGFNEYREWTLFAGEPTVLVVHHYPEPDNAYPDCENPGRVVIENRDGTTVVFATEQAMDAAGRPAAWITWDGDFAPVYRRLLEGQVNLVLTEIQEEDDYIEYEGDEGAEDRDDVS